MQLQRKTARWMCLPASFAMALDLPLASVLQVVGHDGSEIIWPALPEPICRRGFHPQELIDVCLAHGYAATLIELAPCVTPAYDNPIRRVWPDDMAWPRFISEIHISQGVIEGVSMRCGHAVAYDHGRIFDPDGIEYAYSVQACEGRDFYTQRLWRIDRIGA